MTVHEEIELARAKAAIDTANKLTALEKRQAIVNELAKVRTRKPVVTAEVRTLADNLKQEALDHTQAQRRVRSIEESISQHLGRRPQVYLFLANEDPECIQWKQEADRLDRELAAAVAKRNNLPKSDRLRAVELNGELQRLTFAEENLLRTLNNEPHGQRGGVAGVF